MTIFRDRGDGASGPYQGIDNVSVAVPGASVSVTISATNSSGTMATGTFGIDIENGANVGLVNHYGPNGYVWKSGVAIEGEAKIAVGEFDLDFANVTINGDKIEFKTVFGNVSVTQTDLEAGDWAAKLRDNGASEEGVAALGAILGESFDILGNRDIPFDNLDIDELLEAQGDGFLPSEFITNDYPPLEIRAIGNDQISVSYMNRGGGGVLAVYSRSDNEFADLPSEVVQNFYDVYGTAPELSGDPYDAFYHYAFEVSGYTPVSEIEITAAGAITNGVPLDDVVQIAGTNANHAGTSGNEIVWSAIGTDSTIFGGGGDDIISGADLADMLDGGDGHDTVTGGGGDDTVSGGNGDDVLMGGDGNDMLDGGSGHDEIVGGIGHDVIRGGTGDDTVTSGEGNDTIRGDDGEDVIFGEDGDDWLSGGIGNDTLTGGTGRDRLVFAAGDGVDTITDFSVTDDLIEIDGVVLDPADLPADVMAVESGSDVILTYGDGDTILLTGADISDWRPDDGFGGTSGDDVIVGTEMADVISGAGGDDTITGNGGDDTLSGGAGDDLIEGGLGTNAIDGGEGNDTIVLEYGSDTALGGAGDDIFQVVSTFHRGQVFVRDLDGGAGVDTLSYAQNDNTTGGMTINVGSEAGAGTVFGYGSSRARETFSGFEIVEGSQKRDTFRGGAGDDTFRGEGGQDWIDAGGGNNVLTGGGETDTFVFRGDGGHHTITDFDAGDPYWFNIDGEILDDGDMLYVDAEVLDENEVTVTESGGDVIMSYGQGSIRFVGLAGQGFDPMNHVYDQYSHPEFLPTF